MSLQQDAASTAASSAVPPSAAAPSARMCRRCAPDWPPFGGLAAHCVRGLAKGVNWVQPAVIRRAAAANPAEGRPIRSRQRAAHPPHGGR